MTHLGGRPYQPPLQELMPTSAGTSTSLFTAILSSGADGRSYEKKLIEKQFQEQVSSFEPRWGAHNTPDVAWGQPVVVGLRVSVEVEIRDLRLTPAH